MGVSWGTAQVGPGVRALIDKAVLAAGPREKAYKAKDAGDLHLHVSTARLRAWRFEYRQVGKKKLRVLGRYPDPSLRSARLTRDEAKRAIATGKDPALERRGIRPVGEGRREDMSEKWARAWRDEQESGRKPVHADDVITSMERELFPVIGAYPITDVDEPLLPATLQKVEKRGAIETTRRLRQWAERVFEFEGGRRAPPD